MQKYLLSISVVWVLLAFIIGVILMIQPVLKAVKKKPAGANSVSYIYHKYAAPKAEVNRSNAPVKAMVYVGQLGKVQAQVRVK